MGDVGDLGWSDSYGGMGLLLDGWGDSGREMVMSGRDPRDKALEGKGVGSKAMRKGVKYDYEAKFASRLDDSYGDG